MRPWLNRVSLNGAPNEFAVIAIPYVLLRGWSFWGEIGHATTSWYSDSDEYVAVARLPLTTLDFYTWFKPWGLPLLYKLLPGSTAVVGPIAQWLISVASWLLLAAVVRRSLENRIVRVIGPAFVLAFSLVPEITVWDGAILTESLTISLAAVLAAALLLVVSEPTRLNVGLAAVAAACLAITRDTSAYFALAVLLPASLYLLFRRRVGLAVAFAAGSIFLTTIVSASANVRRWEVPLGEIIAFRILHDDEARAYFQRRGMPLRPSLEDDLWAARVPLSRYETDARLDYFRPWFMRHARGVYRSYLLSHPDKALVDPIRNLSSLIAPASDPNDLQALPIDFYKPRGFRDALPRRISRLLYPHDGDVLIAWTAVVLATAGVLAAMRVRSRLWLVPVILLASTIPHAIVVWDGDPTSLGRHALLLAVLVRLGLILLVVLIADAAAKSAQSELA